MRYRFFIVFMVLLLNTTKIYPDIFVLGDRMLDNIDQNFLEMINKYTDNNKINLYYYDDNGIKESNSYDIANNIEENVESAIENGTKKRPFLDLLYSLIDSRKFKSNDKIVIFSNLLYKKRGFINIGQEKKKVIDIDFSRMSPGDGFITSELSPFKKYFEKKSNLNGASVYVITDNNYLFNYETYKVRQYHLKRFYHYFFKKLNAKLVFFGRHNCANSDDSKCDKLYKYFLLGDEPPIVYAPLRDVNYLQYIDLNGSTKSILYDLSQMQ